MPPTKTLKQETVRLIAPESLGSNYYLVLCGDFECRFDAIQGRKVGFALA